MIGMHRFVFSILFLALILIPIESQSQIIRQDTAVQERKTILSSFVGEVVDLTDDIATVVRHTGRRIRKEVKEFNAIDTNYISPNLYNLAFMLEHSTWYEHYRLGNNKGTQSQRLNFSPNLGTKMGIYFIILTME